MIGACVSFMGEIRNPYKILVCKPEGKRRLERFRRRFEDIIKMDIKITGTTT
jgi:hypothetical protein